MRTGRLAKRTQRALALGYRITEDGFPLNPHGEALRASPNPQGYLKFSIPREAPDSDRIVYVHQLAALQWFGSKAQRSEIQVRHLNDVRADNRKENIAVGTRSDNQMDIPLAVRKANGRKTGVRNAVKRKLSDAQLVDLHKARKNGVRVTDLARLFGLAPSTVSYALRGITYGTPVGSSFGK